MHHCLQGEQAPYVSFGIPLASILSKHSLLGGDASPESQQLAKAPKERRPESRNIAKFDTKITKVVPPLSDALKDEIERYERRDIARFEKVRVVKPHF
mmetsp:Transcript_20119/g.37617  ORF Transcript_20119/g.37617 Transcript_20119/m.37617 type:complete len:98 (-) Transcript_20119:1087-1380(-)